MRLTSEDLDRRTPVWDAMSDLFVDIETRWAVPRIALVLVQSGFGSAELERIWHREVVPECAGNLANHGDPTKAFVVDVTALTARAEGAAAGSIPPLPEALVARWDAARALSDTLRNLPESEWVPRAGIWSAFVHAYLATSLETLASLEAQIDVLATTGLTESELVAIFDHVHPRLRSMLTATELADEPRRAIDVRVLIGLATRPP